MLLIHASLDARAQMTDNSRRRYKRTSQKRGSFLFPVYQHANTTRLIKAEGEQNTA